MTVLPDAHPRAIVFIPTMLRQPRLLSDVTELAVRRRLDSLNRERRESVCVYVCVDTGLSGYGTQASVLQSLCSDSERKLRKIPTKKRRGEKRRRRSRPLALSETLRWKIHPATAGFGPQCSTTVSPHIRH